MGQLRFEDLQPHVDMLCDALENKGASSSGIPNPKIFPFANKYRELLKAVRENLHTEESLTQELFKLRSEIENIKEQNQRYRTENVVSALDIFIRKEYIRLWNQR